MYITITAVYITKQYTSLVSSLRMYFLIPHHHFHLVKSCVTPYVRAVFAVFISFFFLFPFVFFSYRAHPAFYLAFFVVIRLFLPCVVVFTDIVYRVVTFVFFIHTFRQISGLSHEMTTSFLLSEWCDGSHQSIVSSAPLRDHYSDLKVKHWGMQGYLCFVFSIEKSFINNTIVYHIYEVFIHVMVLKK